MAEINEKWDVMITYNWDTGKSYAEDLYKALTDRGYAVWRDENNIQGNIGAETAKAIANSELILLLISEKYEKSHNCTAEYRHAHNIKKKIMPIKVENYYPAECSELRLYIAGEICYELFQDKEKNMTKIMIAIEKCIGNGTSKDRLKGFPDATKRILVENVSLDWKRFARGTGFSGVDAIIDFLENDLKDVKSKMSGFLDKLHQSHPYDYMELIEKSLTDLQRNDVIHKLGLDKRVTLKKYYFKKYKKMQENYFLNLNVFNTEKSNDKGFEKEFQMKTKLLLISGITGIGKTSLLKMCLLNWANESLWSNIHLVFYLKFDQLNYDTSIDEQVQKLDTKISEEWNNFSDISKLFIIDGLNVCSKESPFINAVAEALKNPNNKCIVAGRFRAIKLFKDEVKVILKKEKEPPQIASFYVTGLNDDEIRKYIENNVINNQKEKINDYLNASDFFKAIVSVPFCLEKVCEVFNSPSMDSKYSFNSLTVFHRDIFLYFLQTHVNKHNKPVINVKQYLSQIYELVYQVLDQGKASFPYSEIPNLKDFKEIDYKQLEAFFGNQLSHFSFLIFCASIHACIQLSPKEITGNKNLRVCLPMICGIMNSKDKFNEGLGDNFQSLTKVSNEEKKKQLLNIICESLPKKALFGENEEKEFFIECFYEAQATISNKMKRVMKRREWLLLISDESEPWKTVQQKYFFNNFFEEKMKLKYLCVKKVRLSSDEIELIKKCSTNVSWVIFKTLVKIEGWEPSNDFKLLWIFIDSNVTKADFECFYPWIKQCKKLRLHITRKIAFIKCMYDKISTYTNIRKLKVRYCDERINSIKEFESFVNKASQSSS